MLVKKQSVVTGGSLASALLSFLPLACCVFPTALAFLGTGSLAFAASLMPYRPYFVAAAVAFLGLGFYFAYRPTKQECGCNEPHPKRHKRLSRRLLWIAAALTLLLILFPYLLTLLPV